MKRLAGNDTMKLVEVARHQANIPGVSLELDAKRQHTKPNQSIPPIVLSHKPEPLA